MYTGYSIKALHYGLTSLSPTFYCKAKQQRKIRAYVSLLSGPPQQFSVKKNLCFTMENSKLVFLLQT